MTKLHFDLPNQREHACAPKKLDPLAERRPKDCTVEKPPFWLAQLNIARLKEPLDSPAMSGFVSQLESIYAAAESAEGFVWRLKPDEHGTFGISAPGDAQLVVTMSVWESIEALHAYVYRSAHQDPLRNRAEWFEKTDGPNLVLWWIPNGTLPRVGQGMARLKYLKLHGPTPFAFTFKDQFPPPEE